MMRNDEVHIWLTNLLEWDIEKITTLLAPADREELQELRHPKRIREFVVGRYLVRNKVQFYSGYKLDNIEFSCNQFGKPKANAGVEFNVSHSGHYISLAFSKNSPVGIDIECLGREFPELGGLGDLQVAAPTNFSDWTKLEAKLKFQGKGLQGDLANDESQVFTVEENEYVFSVAASKKIKKFLIKGWIDERILHNTQERIS